MTRIKLCTLTGADDSTPLDDLWDLGQRFPFVEWGVLLNPLHSGTGRFPSEAWLLRLFERLMTDAIQPKFSLHVCGRAVADFIAQPRTSAAGRLAVAFPRIQLNFMPAGSS
jgi:hypothetical protein